MIFDTQAPQVEQGPETPDSVLHTAETEDSDQKMTADGQFPRDGSPWSMFEG
uniref:Uncharacterized protein n=1 Tax=Magallana gigas TaxID=29159 RepID=K1QEA4_MAGGI